MLALAALLACSEGPAPPAPGGSAPPERGSGAPGPADQAARSAPTAATAWEGPWTASVHAARPDDAGPAALADALAAPVHAWTGSRPVTRPGEVALLWLDPGADPRAAARALAPRPGPQGEVVAVLAPGDEAWRAAAAAALPWAGLGVIDPTVSATLWTSLPPDDALAGRLAGRVVADHHALTYTPAAGPYPPGLNVALGPWNPGFLTSDDPVVRAEAARAAPRSGANPDALADDPSVAVRLAVAASTQTTSVRIHLATDPDPQVRARAADALDDVALLATLADDPSSVVRVVATHRLGALAATRGPEVAAALGRALGAPDAYQRWKASWGLGRVPGSAATLVPLLQDPDIDVRREAARGLGRLGDPTAVEPLLATLRDDNSFVRRWAASALGALGDPRARAPLRTAATDPTALVAQAASHALGALGERVALPPFTPPAKPADDAALDALLASPDATVRKDAARFLAGRDELARLRRLADDRDSEVRKSAVEAMGWSAATAPGALAFLGDPDNDVRVTAIDAVRRGRVGSAESLAPLLADRDSEVRLRAAEALAALGADAPGVAAALDVLARDPDERVRAAVVAALPDRLDPGEPAALVRRAARGARPGADSDPAVAPDPARAAWAAGVWAREDDLVHLRFSWNDPEDRPASHRALRPPTIRPYGHPDRG